MSETSMPAWHSHGETGLKHIKLEDSLGKVPPIIRVQSYRRELSLPTSVLSKTNHHKIMFHIINIFKS